MSVKVEDLINAKLEWRDSLADYDQAVEERVLEELEAGADVNLAVARARVATHSLFNDTVEKVKALDRLHQEYIANGDAELAATKVLNYLDSINNIPQQTAPTDAN